MRNGWFWLKIGVTIALVSVLLAALDWREALARLQDVSLPLVVVALSLNTLAILVSACRWHRLLLVLVAGARLAEAIRFYWIGSLFSTVLPSNIGGDAVRLALARRMAPLAVVFTSVMAERATGLLTLAAIGLVALMLLPDAADVIPMHAALVVILALGLLAVPIVLAQAPRWFGWLGQRPWARKPIATKVLAKLGRVAESLETYRRRPFELVVTVVLSLVFYAVLFAFQASLIFAVGDEIGLFGVAVAAPLVILVSTLPISINGIGVSEGAFVVLYALMGVDPEAALAAAVLRRLVVTAVALFGVPFWLLERSSLQAAR